MSFQEMPVTREDPAATPGLAPGRGAGSSSVVSSTERPLRDDRGPELADLRRFGRRMVNRFVDRAREDERPQFATMLTEHLGLPADQLPVAEQQWPAYEHVNVQAALDAWLLEPGREHRVVGVAGYRHRGSLGLADLLGALPEEARYGPRPGNLSRTALPTGPDGETLECLRVAIVLASDAGGHSAILFRGPDGEDGRENASVEVIASREGAGAEIAARLADLAVEHNVYRGQVVSFGRSMFGRHGSILRFHRREPLPPGELILPAATFDDVRRQVVGVARHRERLRSAGQHLKRGLLLYGPPGVGKTHTVRFLVGELAGTTIVQLSGDTLGAIKQACSIARTLQPAMIVVEDVDLIAEQRDYGESALPLLFTLLNEMDGLEEDADVVFLLTTNRADLLEDALASRPGRVDQAVHIGLPDREARRRLVELYRRGLDLDDSRLDTVLDRTEGVTASFLKELLRRAAVVAADRDETAAPLDAVRVTAGDLEAALEDLLDTRNQMTRRALGLEGIADETGVAPKSAVGEQASIRRGDGGAGG
jgi:ATPase family associated with various cellular activities (AAA)